MVITSRVGKRGAVVIPAELRRRFGIDEGTLVIAEAHEDGVLIRRAVAVPVDAERRQRLLEEANAAYATLRADSRAWAEEQAERTLWDATLLDGVDSDEIWTEEGDVVRQAGTES